MSTLSDAADDPSDRFFAVLAARLEDEPTDLDADECDGCDGACDPPDRDRFLALSIFPSDPEGFAVWNLPVVEA